MDPSSIGLIVVYFLLVLCSAFFCAVEMAFSSATKIKFLNYKEKAPKKVALCLSIQEKYNFYLITLLVGSNIVNAALAAVSTIFSVRVYNAMHAAGHSVAEATVTTVATAVTTIVIFLFCETVPKRIAKDRSEEAALLLAPVLKTVSTVLYPVSIVFMTLSHLLDRMIKPEREPTVTEEELSEIIESSEEDGVLDEDQSDLLQSALTFSDTRVADVLTLRDDVVWLDIHSEKEDILRKIRETKYSRLPVCDGSLDAPVGILMATDFLKAYILGSYTRLSRLLRKPYFTTLDANIDDLKTEMSGRKQHLALVKDKTGTAIVGVVTIEDFLEELVGEIYDESDTVDYDFVKLGGKYFEMSGKLPLTEVCRRMGYYPGVPIPVHKTVSTWALEKLGKIPEEDDEFEVGDLTVTVNETENSRVSRLTIKISDPMIDLLEENEEEEDREI